MKETIAKYLKQILTEDDNATFCIAKCLALVAFFSFIGYAIFGLVKDHYDVSSYANGLMQVLLGSGGLIAGKQFSQKQ